MYWSSVLSFIRFSERSLRRAVKGHQASGRARAYLKLPVILLSFIFSQVNPIIQMFCTYYSSTCNLDLIFNYKGSVATVQIQIRSWTVDASTLWAAHKIQVIQFIFSIGEVGV